MYICLHQLACNAEGCKEVFPREGCLLDACLFTRAELRSAAHKLGWTHNRTFHQDFCPDHRGATAEAQKVFGFERPIKTGGGQ
jgi:hypothetical protein